jgi:hypothetical protein
MSLAKPAINWSHVAGKRQALTRVETHRAWNHALTCGNDYLR